MTWPGDGANPAGWSRRRGRGERGEQSMVPRAQFSSYYGRPVLKEPVWRSPEVPGYFFLGGLAGASSVLAAFCEVTGNRELSRAAKITAGGAIGLSTAALISDLGRPERFLNMLRVFKPTSPMSVGSWLLTTYGSAAAAAAACTVTGWVPKVGALATAGAALVGPGVATYTAVLLSDTSIPAWHEGYREMPYLFAGSAASAAGGMGMLAVPTARSGPAARLAVIGAATEIAAKHLLTRRLGPNAEPYHSGRSGAFMRTAEILAAAGLAGAVLARRNRWLAAASGAALLSASALTRFGVFEAGRASAKDPKYTVVPQRERLNGKSEAGQPGRTEPVSPAR
ncbi:MAG TPA: NrfD/PsrC family molybdoenzyme membrane anchor subunit [Streptosporangiaceae bacterium]|jgi:formate-dependent nitrite reductase membrane component NrfD|nr:NrfD/PsrC family molybdoenzyme membrane anchor subunit [Streptosporangiaceae bacterium]